MSTTIERKEEYVLTRAQFEQLQANGQLVIGATYTITDDPTVEGILTGEEIAKKAERDASGNVITSTYRTVADSYTKAQVDALIPTKTSDLINDGDGSSLFATEAYVEENEGKIDSISVNNTPQTIDANKNVDIPLASSSNFGVVQFDSNYGITNIVTSSSSAIGTFTDGSNSITFDGNNLSDLSGGVADHSWEYSSYANYSATAPGSAYFYLYYDDTNDKWLYTYDVMDSEYTGSYDLLRQGEVPTINTGIIATVAASTSEIISKTDSHKVITPSNLDYAVKTSLTSNANTLTSAEKATVKSWLGVTTIKTSMDATATVNTQYYLGSQSTVTITLPSTANAGDIITVDFTSGSTATTLSITNNNVAGDTSFAPEANKLVEINFKYDGTYWKMLVSSLDIPSGV